MCNYVNNFKINFRRNDLKWFGNLVTFKFWNDLLLGEGLTTYFEDVIINNVSTLHPNIQNR